MSGVSVQAHLNSLPDGIRNTFYHLYCNQHTEIYCSVHKIQPCLVRENFPVFCFLGEASIHTAMKPLGILLKKKSVSRHQNIVTCVEKKQNITWIWREKCAAFTVYDLFYYWHIWWNWRRYYS